MASFGLPGEPFRREPFVQIGHQALRGAADVVEIHRVRADAGELRAAERLRRVPRSACGHDLADGPPAQAAGAEGERLEKAVVQLVPRAGIDEFRYDPRVKVRGRAVAARR